jgi:sugar phosphate permease
LGKGGKKGSATLSGLTDAMGYLGSIFSGVSTGTIADKYGWGIVFALLSLFALLTLSAMGVYYWYVELRQNNFKHMPLRETDQELETLQEDM